eukprot:scaffold45170_cov32-Tisochrysis_lutea.AAC.1
MSAKAAVVLHYQLGTRGIGNEGHAHVINLRPSVLFAPSANSWRKWLLLLWHSDRPHVVAVRTGK